MPITLTPASIEQASVVEHLMQLYCYDFSELLHLEIEDSGRFDFALHKSYWTDARYHPFLIHVDGRLAGFVVVDSKSRLTDEPLWDMSQFFVLRRHRRSGVGANAAMATFDAFRGKWEVREALQNTPAQAFWRRVIERYTGGKFREVLRDDERWHGPVQMFENGVISSGEE